MPSPVRVGTRAAATALGVTGPQRPALHDQASAAVAGDFPACRAIVLAPDRAGMPDDRQLVAA